MAFAIRALRRHRRNHVELKTVLAVLDRMTIVGPVSLKNAYDHLVHPRFRSNWNQNRPKLISPKFFSDRANPHQWTHSAAKLPNLHPTKPMLLTFTNPLPIRASRPNGRRSWPVPWPVMWLRRSSGNSSWKNHWRSHRL